MDFNKIDFGYFVIINKIIIMVFEDLHDYLYQGLHIKVLVISKLVVKFSRNTLC